MFRAVFRFGLVSGQILEYESKSTFDTLEDACYCLNDFGDIVDKQLTTSGKGRIEIITASNGVASVPNDKITFVERWAREYPAGLMRPDLAKNIGLEQLKD